MTAIAFAFVLFATLAPLLVSPLLALATTATAYPLLRRLRLAMGVSHQSCVCLASTDPQAPLGSPERLRYCWWASRSRSAVCWLRAVWPGR